jgi:tetratricopeptide (TPR) repeat protein
VLSRPWSHSSDHLEVDCLACGAKLHLMQGPNGPGVQAILSAPRRVVGALNRINCAAALHELGFLYRIVNRFEDALRVLNEARTQLEGLPRDGNPAYGNYLLNTLGDIYERIGEIKVIQGAAQEARTNLEIAKTLLRRAGSSGRDDVDDLMRNLPP